MIVVVKLFGSRGEQTCNSYLDEGSSVTLISSDLADSLGLEGRVDPLRIKWVDGTVQHSSSCRITPLEKSMSGLGLMGVCEQEQDEEGTDCRNLAAQDEEPSSKKAVASCWATPHASFSAKGRRKRMISRQ